MFMDRCTKAGKKGGECIGCVQGMCERYRQRQVVVQARGEVVCVKGGRCVVCVGRWG